MYDTRVLERPFGTHSDSGTIALLQTRSQTSCDLSLCKKARAPLYCQRKQCNDDECGAGRQSRPNDNCQGDQSHRYPIKKPFSIKYSYVAARVLFNNYKRMYQKSLMPQCERPQSRRRHCRCFACPNSPGDYNDFLAWWGQETGVFIDRKQNAIFFPALLHLATQPRHCVKYVGLLSWIPFLQETTPPSKKTASFCSLR
jgi:hypothetical protein